MHGYQIIQEIAERSGGAWRPSPGSVYPTVSQLADEGLVRTEKAEGRSVIHLTDAGRTYVDEHREELDAVWNTAAAEDGFGALRESVGLVMGAVSQVAQVGREEQVTEAVRLLDDTRRRLYLLLAGEPTASRPPRAATPTRAGARRARPGDRHAAGNTAVTSRHTAPLGFRSR